MNRYIDQDKVIDAVLELNTTHCVSWLDAVTDMIDCMSPADVQPVVHGHWFKRFYIQSFGKSLEMYVCSKCQQEYSYDAETGESEYNFCPNCGAKMDGKGAGNVSDD